MRCPTHMLDARLAILVLAALKGQQPHHLASCPSEYLEHLQAEGAASLAPSDAESEQAKQQLAALQEEQKSLKRQLVGLQQAEAGHLKTISEVRSCIALLPISIHREHVSRN